MVELTRWNWSNYLCLAIKFLTSKRWSSNCSWYDGVPQFQSLSKGNGHVAVSNNYILYHLEGHKQKSHGIFCLYNWWQNSGKISSVGTSLLIPRQRFNIVSHQASVSHLPSGKKASANTPWSCQKLILQKQANIVLSIIAEGTHVVGCRTAVWESMQPQVWKQRWSGKTFLGLMNCRMKHLPQLLTKGRECLQKALA